MTTQISPFELNRWENEDARHFYYLGTSEYRKIRDSRKHCFVVGHRGTGKTTLLKALDWNERTHDLRLVGALHSDPFGDGVVGCYFGLQYLHLQNLDDWLANESNNVKHDLYSSYLRGLWLEEACTAVSSLRTRAGISSLDGEIEGFAEVVDSWNTWVDSTRLEPGGVRDMTYLSLKRIRDTAASLTLEIYSRASDFKSKPTDAVRDLGLNRLPKLANDLFSALTKLLPSRADGLSPWLFQMCLDEGEYLSEDGRRSIRTMVRECRSPLLMTVASLDDLGVETLNSQVRLTVNDRLLLDLRDRSLKQFADLVNGVINERFRTIEVDAVFDINQLLSAFDLNELLLQAGTERPSSRRQIQEWTQKWSNPDRGSWSPIREYLGGASIAPTDRFDVRAIDSAGFRKKQLAAYLRLLALIGEEKPIYAGAPIVLRMMENSLRDLFMFLEQCFEQTTSGAERSMRSRVERFLRRPFVSIRAQDSALSSVAKLKMDNLDERIVNLTSLSRRIVDFLSRVSHRLDMEDSGAPITIPERTMFVISVPTSSADLGERREENARTRAIVEAIHNCVREGYLVGGAEPIRPDELHIRVNRTLAKLHGFAYRAPQYESRIEWGYLDSIALGADGRALDRLAAGAASAILDRGSRPARRRDEGSLSTSVTVPLFDDLPDIS